MSAERPLRVLHVLYDLERGGVQAWLRAALEAGAAHSWHFDVAVSSVERQDLRGDFERLGARIFSCPRPSRPRAYVRHLTQVLLHEGPYDVVHSHFDPAVLPLVAARRAGVPMRIAHSHRGCRELVPLPSLVRLGLSPVVRHLTSRYATHRVACSDRAALAMFGRGAVRRGSVSLLRAGIRASDFARTPVYRPTESQPRGRPVVLHIGRFAREKNHTFLLRIFRAILDREPGAELWLAGDGPLVPQVRQTARALGLGECVKFLGSQADVVSLYAAADVLLMPSEFEGLPLTAVEAQASGLPCVLATAITGQVVACADLVRWCALNEPVSSWAAAALTTLSTERRTRVAEVGAAGFDISDTNTRLADLYEFARHECI